jgi:hypothetical protein
MNIDQYIDKPHIVKAVDMYGFCGRDLHPERSDAGKVVIPIEVIENAVYDLDPSMNYTVFRAKTSDGRTLDFVHFELKSLESYSV